MLQPKWQHFGGRIATSGYALLAMTAFFDMLRKRGSFRFLFFYFLPRKAVSKAAMAATWRIGMATRAGV